MEYTKYDIGDKELAYIAGFMDGERCIQISRGGNLSVTVDNTDIEPLQFFMDIVGGNVTLSKRATKERKKAYRWSIIEEEAPEFLRTILPYLICKKAEATLGIEFEFAEEPRRLDIYLELRLLKQRGKL